jgi:hypothetical protein
MTLFLAACEKETGASLEITGARVARASEGRVVVEVDLLASEAMGGNVGIYCTRATFAVGDRPPIVEQCAADLEDGDSKTVRLVSDQAIAPRTGVAVRVRLGRVDVGRSVEAPDF